MWLPTAPLGTEADLETVFETTVTASASTHTKGMWTQLVASVSFDVLAFDINADNVAASATNTSMLLDVGIGGAGSEVVLVANILCGGNAIDSSRAAHFPIFIPSGTRISARIQAAIGSDTTEVSMRLFGGGTWQQQTFQAVDTIGSDTTTSGGVSLKPSGIQQVIASTAEAYKAIGFGVDTAGDTTTSNQTKIVNIFVGAAAAEKSLASGIIAIVSSSEKINVILPAPGCLPLELNIPSGVRLSAEAEAGSNALGINLYGFR